MRVFKGGWRGGWRGSWTQKGTSNQTWRRTCCPGLVKGWFVSGLNWKCQVIKISKDLDNHCCKMKKHQPKLDTTLKKNYTGIKSN